MQLCQNCITVICFAIGPNSQLSHLLKSDGHDGVHVLHYNTEQDKLVMDAFRINVFPMVLVFVPKDGVFYVYKGDVSDIKHIKMAVEQRQMRDIWKVTPRVVFKST